MVLVTEETEVEVYVSNYTGRGGSKGLPGKNIRELEGIHDRSGTKC